MNHDDLTGTLRRAGSDAEAAEIHGSLCARLCVNGEQCLHGWLEEALGEEASANAAWAEARRRLIELYAGQWRDLEAHELGFEPLLPDDGADLAARADALACWCQGFLHGLARAGLPDEKQLRERLRANHVIELMHDFAEITRAGFGDSDDPLEREAGENAYAELIEFVRVGVQMAYEELAPLREPVGTDKTLQT